MQREGALGNEQKPRAGSLASRLRQSGSAQKDSGQRRKGPEHQQEVVGNLGQGFGQRAAGSEQLVKKSSKMGPSEMAGIAFVSKGPTNHVDWRAAMVADLVAKTEPPPGGGSTFLAKREC
jgi:hypothetical protein